MQILAWLNSAIIPSFEEKLFPLNGGQKIGKNPIPFNSSREDDGGSVAQGEELKYHVTKNADPESERARKELLKRNEKSVHKIPGIKFHLHFYIVPKRQLLTTRPEANNHFSASLNISFVAMATAEKY